MPKPWTLWFVLEEERLGKTSQRLSGSRLEGEYAATLGQVDPGRELQSSVSAVVLGEASPSTMEQGGVEPLPVLAASPFHSERVKDEVELLRRRPIGLDREQARVEAERANPSSNLEPDYSLAFGADSNPGPRVAQVETVGNRLWVLERSWLRLAWV